MLLAMKLLFSRTAVKVILENLMKFGNHFQLHYLFNTPCYLFTFLTRQLDSIIKLFNYKNIILRNAN
jgi:hypothetical protein